MNVVSVVNAEMVFLYAKSDIVFSFDRRRPNYLPRGAYSFDVSDRKQLVYDGDCKVYRVFDDAINGFEVTMDYKYDDITGDSGLIGEGGKIGGLNTYLFSRPFLYLVTGWTDSYLHKYSNDSELLYSRSIDDVMAEAPSELVSDDEGIYAPVAPSSLEGSTFAKFGFDGGVLHTADFPSDFTSDADHYYWGSIVYDDDSGYHYLAAINIDSIGQTEGLIVDYDADLNLVNQYGGYAYGALAQPGYMDGYYYLPNDADGGLLKVDPSDGSTVWKWKTDYTGEDVFGCIARNGYVYVFYELTNGGALNIAKLDSGGNVQFEDIEVASSSIISTNIPTDIFSTSQGILYVDNGAVLVDYADGSSTVFSGVPDAEAAAYCSSNESLYIFDSNDYVYCFDLQGNELYSWQSDEGLGAIAVDWG